MPIYEVSLRPWITVRLDANDKSHARFKALRLIDQIADREGGCPEIISIVAHSDDYVDASEVDEDALEMPY